jgi:ribose transport system substrate-binding protein
MRRLAMAALTATLSVIVAGTMARAEPFDDGQSKTYYADLKGKKVGFVPLSMGFDLT